MSLTPLDRALRAARRGHDASARVLLDEVLRFDPTHEEALLWRARVAESPSEGASFLTRVLAVNPDNRWAAQQLAETDGAAAASASGTTDTLKCSNCGGSVSIHPERGPRAVMCTYCGSVLDLSSSQLDILGQMDPQVGPSQPVRPGDEAVFFGENHLVLGWLQYEGWDDEDRWRWDEWQLVSDSGVPRYLSHSSDEGWTIQTPIRPTPEIGRSAINLKEGRAAVKESGPARITAMQGEFTWRPRLNETLKVIEAQRGDQHYSAELTAEEIEVVGGPRISERELWEAFGRTEQLSALDAGIVAKKARRKRSRRSAFIALLAAGLYFLGLGNAASKGTQLASITTEFVAASPPAPAPEAPPGVTYVTGDRVQLGTFEVKDVNEVHEVAIAARETPGQPSYTVAARIQIENPEGELRELMDIYSLSTDGQPHADSREQFRPTRTGTHTLYAFVLERSPDTFTILTTVRSGLWSPGPFGLSCGLALLLAVILFLSGGFGRIE